MTVAELVTAMHDRLPKNYSLRGFVQTVNEVVEDIRRKNKSWSFWYKQGQIALIAEYTTGTVTATNASTTITGSGTTFTSGMVGRKIRIADGEYYTVATYSSATSITIDVAYAGSTTSGATYSIYQDAYDLPSDCMSVVGVWDATNRHWLRGVDSTDIQDARIVLSPSGQWSRCYAQMGYDSTTGYPKLVFSPEPTTAALLYLWYYKRPTAVTGPGSTPDLPTHLHNVLLLGVVWKYTRSPDDERLYRGALMEIVGEDRTIQRDSFDPVSGDESWPSLESAIAEWTRGQTAAGY